MKVKTVVLIVLCLIIAVGLGFVFKDLLFNNEDGPLYESRLLGKDDYKISKTEIKKAITTFKEDKLIDECEILINGKVLKVIIETSTLEIDDLKIVLDGALEIFNEEDLTYYDLEILVDNPNDGELFPLIGYKNNDTAAISYIN